MYALPWLWLPLYSAGMWAALSLRLATSVSYMQPQSPTQRLRTPLLRLHASTLKLNANAPSPQQRRAAGKLLLLRRS